MRNAPREIVPVLKAILEQQAGQPERAGDAAALYSILQLHSSLDIATNDHTVRMRRIASALRPDHLQDVGEQWKVIFNSMLEQFNLNTTPRQPT